MTLIKPNPARRIGARARYEDPDLGRMVWETLDPSLTTIEAREAWAARKSKALARRRIAIAEGAPRATGTDLAAAIDRYFDDHPHLQESTRELYRGGADKLLAWGRRHGVTSADDLAGTHLVAFRASLIKEPKRTKAKGGKRGATLESDLQRAPNTINGELRKVGTVLNYLRRLGLLPRLTSDDLKDGLVKLKSPPKRIHYLKTPELQTVVRAALKHDAQCFKETRAEHKSRELIGTTPRYTAVAPVIVTALITGLRFSHLLDLQWRDVDLAGDGAIVPDAGTHTKRTGIVDLVISPGLRRLLEALRKRNGGDGRVFGLTRNEANAALRRLVGEYGAPEGATWQAFRRSCGCYLTNAPGIFGAASAYRSAKQLGHSVQVAERHYVDVVRGIPRDACTLEAAMQIEGEVSAVIKAATSEDSEPVRLVG